MPTFLRRLAIVAAFTIPTIASAAAQAPPAPVAVGARVRLTLPEPGPRRFGVIPPERSLVGEVVGITAETLTVRPHPLVSAIDVPRALVQRVHVSRGTSRWRSAGSGAIGGALVGMLWGHTLYAWDLRSSAFDTQAHARSRGAIAGAVSLAVVQAIFPQERWRRVR